MADDIYLPTITVVPKLRWFEVTVNNPAGRVPSLQALAETVPTINEQVVGGPRERRPTDDLDITFNPADADHLALAGLLDRIVKRAYLAKLEREKLAQDASRESALVSEI